MTLRAAPRRSKQLHVGGAAVAQLLAGGPRFSDDLPSAAAGTLAANDEQVASRARLGVKKILLAIEEHPRSTQAKRLVRIVSDIYARDEFRIDVKELKALNPALAAACIDCLMYRVLRARMAE